MRKQIGKSLVFMIRYKKYLLGLYTKKIYEESGLVKNKLFGITIKKYYMDSIIKNSNFYEGYDTLFNKISRFPKKKVYSLCKENQYNLILHRHLGDSYVLLCLKELFEEKYKKKLHFIVKPRQKLLMDLFNIKNFTIMDSNAILNIL